jgi:hypothetical protein
MPIGPQGEIVGIGVQDDPFMQTISGDDFRMLMMMANADGWSTGNLYFDGILETLQDAFDSDDQEIVVTAPARTPTVSDDYTVRDVFDGYYEVYRQGDNGEWIELGSLWRRGNASNSNITMQGTETEETNTVGVTIGARGVELGVEGTMGDRSNPQTLEFWTEVYDGGM